MVRRVLLAVIRGVRKVIESRIVSTVRTWLDGTTTRRQVFPAYVFLACGAIGAFWYSDSLDDERAQEAAEARYGACVQFNVEQEGDRVSGKQSILALFGFVSPDDLASPDQQAAYDRLSDAVDAANPFRNCSPTGIATYYENPPADPATPEEP